MTSFTNPEMNLVELIERMIHSRILEVHTATPGIISKYDAAKQTADVQVALKRVVKSTKETLPVPIIKDVPVVFPRTAKSSAHWPLEKGDGVLLIFSERNIDPWISSEGTGPVDPDPLPRFHDFSDAVAIPGLFPSTKPMEFPTPTEGEGYFLSTDKMKLALTGEGKIYLSRKAETPASPVPLGDVLMEFMKEIIKQVTAISDAIATGPVGVGNLSAPVPPDPGLITKMQAVSNALAAAKKLYVTDAPTNVVSKIIFVERGE